MKSVIQLHAHDNVVIALKDLDPGAVIIVRAQSISLKTTVGFGHKIAIAPIEKGDQVLKYGLPIGRATHLIAAGEHVHTHNLVSDYTSDGKEAYV